MLGIAVEVGEAPNRGRMEPQLLPIELGRNRGIGRTEAGILAALCLVDPWDPDATVCRLKDQATEASPSSIGGAAAAAK